MGCLFGLFLVLNPLFEALYAYEGWSIDVRVPNLQEFVPNKVGLILNSGLLNALLAKKRRAGLDAVGATGNQNPAISTYVPPGGKIPFRVIATLNNAGHTVPLAKDSGHIFSAERPPSAIAGRRDRWIERGGSEGTWPALLPAGPVPERRNVRSVLIETTDGPAIRWTGLFAYFLSWSDGALNVAFHIMIPIGIA